MRDFLDLWCVLGLGCLLRLRNRLGTGRFLGLRCCLELHLSQGLDVAIDQQQPLACRLSDRFRFALARDLQMPDRSLVLLLVVVRDGQQQMRGRLIVEVTFLDRTLQGLGGILPLFALEIELPQSREEIAFF